jgi:hypothetical protein
MLIPDLIKILYTSGGSEGSEGSDAVYRSDDVAVAACRKKLPMGFEQSLNYRQKRLNMLVTKSISINLRRHAWAVTDLGDAAIG